MHRYLVIYQTLKGMREEDENGNLTLSAYQIFFLLCWKVWNYFGHSRGIKSLVQNSLLFAQLVQYFILNILKKDPPPPRPKKKKKLGRNYVQICRWEVNINPNSYNTPYINYLCMGFKTFIVYVGLKNRHSLPVNLDT